MNYKGLIRTLSFIWETMIVLWDHCEQESFYTIAEAANQLPEVYGINYKVGNERTPDDELVSTIVKQIEELREVRKRVNSVE